VIILPLLCLLHCFSVFFCLWHITNTLIQAKRPFYVSEIDLAAMSTFLPVINVIAAIRFRRFCNIKVNDE